MYLNQIEELLDTLEADGARIGTFRKHFPGWVHVAFNYPNSWTNNHCGRIDEHAIDALDTLADRLNSICPTVETSQLGSLSEYIAQVIIQLSNDETLTTATRRTAMITARHVQECIENLAAFGDLSLQKALESLIGCLARVTAESKNTDDWKATVNKFIWPFAYNIGISITTEWITNFLGPYTPPALLPTPDQ